MTSYRLLFSLCLLLFLNGCQRTPPPPPEDPVALRLAALRWPLNDTVADGSAPSDTEVEQLTVEGKYDQARSLLAERIRQRVATTGSLTDETVAAGPAPGDAREQLLALRQLAYDHALAWVLDGDPQNAFKARQILLRFADAAPQWPLYGRKETRIYPVDSVRYLHSPDAGGLWGSWHPLDLRVSWPLLRAYDMIRPTFQPGEERKVREGLLVYHKELIDRFSGLRDLYNNLWGYHLVAVLRFGQVLDKPEYIEETVRYLDEILRYSYAPDGFFREVTPDYHFQITSRLLGALPRMVAALPPAPGRAAFPDLEKQHAIRFAQIRAALALLALPDGSHVNLNDSWPKRMQWAKEKPSGDFPPPTPGLLGVSGVAKLASGGMTAFLQFGGIRGHDHRDALGLNWYAGGREVFSETGYREQPEKNIRFERAWSSSTASHLTAAIDEELHFTDRTGHVIPDPAPRAGFVSHPPENRGAHPVEAALPAAARFSNQGRLLLWDARSPGVQAMEAEQEHAYPGKATLFRRTVVMVPLSGDEGYLIDLFRIKGGSTHDYFLRGNLGEPYRFGFDRPLAPMKGALYTYLNVQKAGAVAPPLKGVATYDDGMEVISRLVEVAGSGPAPLHAISGEAPAIRRPGTAPFSLIRRTSQGGTPLESCFVWVHETTRSGSPRIREIRTQTGGPGGNDVTLVIELDNRTDVLFSGTGDQSRFRHGGREFQGRLAHLSTLPDTPTTGHVFSGGPVTVTASGEKIAEGKRPLTGTVIATTRREHGDATDSLLVRPDQPLPPSASFHLAHIDFGDTIRFSIPVTGVEREHDALRITLAHTPGFIRREHDAVMTQFPGWRVAGETRIRLE